MKTTKLDWKTTVKLSIAFLQFCGLWPDGVGTYKKNLYIVRTIFFLTGVISQIVKASFIYNDLTTLTGRIYLIIAKMLFFLKTVFLVRNISTLKQLWKILESEFQPTANKICLVQPNLNFWNSIFVAFMAMCLLTNMFRSIFPLLDSSNKEKKIPFLAWYTYNTSVSPNYELTYIYQVATYAYTCYALLNIDTIVTAWNMYVESQFDVLRDNIKNIRRDNADVELVRCIKHYLLILR